jgi:hypothetical protein
LDGIDSNCLQHSVGSHFCTHSATFLDAFITNIAY